MEATENRNVSRSREPLTVGDTADRSSGKMLTRFDSVKVTSRVGYILFGAQSKLNLQAPLFRNFQFQDGDIRASNEAQDPVHACPEGMPAYLPLVGGALTRAVD